MYKVFIDKRTLKIVQTSKANWKQEPVDVTFQPGLTWGDLAKWLDESRLDEVRVGSEDAPEETIKKLFKQFKWVEAAGGIVKKDSGVLFIYRHDKWDLPKGKIEKGECPEEAAVREVEEECGIRNPVIVCHLTDTFHTYSVYGPDTIKKTYWFGMNYAGEEQLVPQAEEGITTVQWVAWDDLEKIKQNTFSSIPEVLDAADKWINSLNNR